MKKSTELSIIIPAYREEENLHILLPRLNKVLQELSVSFEILVVDSVQPTDQTQLVCEDYQATYVRRTGGNDYGSAIRTGVLNAQGRWIVIMDADGSHSPEFIPNLYSERSEATIVIASRYVGSGSSDNYLLLILMSKIVNFFYAWVLQINCKDVSNSFRLYPAVRLKELQLVCKNFDIVEEILVKLLRKRPKPNIKEIPYCFKERLFGHSKRKLFSFALTYILTLIRLRFIR